MPGGGYVVMRSVVFLFFLGGFSHCASVVEWVTLTSRFKKALIFLFGQRHILEIFSVAESARARVMLIPTESRRIMGVLKPIATKLKARAGGRRGEAL